VVRWVDAFCSGRTATIEINGKTSENRELPQAGLPQGSPLSPILFLFFNADLVQQEINKKVGSVAFVDDYTAWVTGPTSEANHEGIQAIIDRALDWERRSGATFEADKTAIIHFSRKASRVDNSVPFQIKGETVQPSDQVRILGVAMDSELRFRPHIARAASKALKAVMALKQLKGLSTGVARQLFTAMVAPVMDYASNVWRYACGTRLTKVVDRIQRTGAQAIIGTFKTVATAVAEAEAGILPAHDRFSRRALKLWIDTHTLPRSHPLRTTGFRLFTRFVSPMQKLAKELQGIPLDRLETVKPFPVAPWIERIETITEEGDPEGTEWAQAERAVRIATSSSARNAMVGLGWARRAPVSLEPGGGFATSSATLGPRNEQNPYTAELAAIATALNSLLPKTRHQDVMVFTNNKAAALTLRRPRQQSGQVKVIRIYKTVKRLRQQGNAIRVVWTPMEENFPLAKMAKIAARKSTELDSYPKKRSFRAKSTTFNLARKGQGGSSPLPERVGAWSKRIDTALPGRHTRMLYDPLRPKEAGYWRSYAQG
jgi:ribonuclease HI